MAAATPAEIRAGIAANLATITGVQILAYMLASPTPPFIQIYPGPMAYDAAMARGLDRPVYMIQAAVSTTTDQGAQIMLDQLLEASGAMSVKAAVESDRTLGGKVGGLRVTEMSGYKWLVLEGHGMMLGADWTVEVLARGN